MEITVVQCVIEAAMELGYSSIFQVVSYAILGFYKFLISIETFSTHFGCS